MAVALATGNHSYYNALGIGFLDQSRYDYTVLKLARLQPELGEIEGEC
jgi:hypothetical protein